MANKKKRFVSGFVSIIGRPNAGKSTLLNALVGSKVAIVADKPQTTRTAVQGVWNAPGLRWSFSIRQAFTDQTRFSTGV